MVHRQNESPGKKAAAIVLAVLVLFFLSTAFLPVEKIRLLRSAYILGMTIMVIGGNQFIDRHLPAALKRVWLSLLFVEMFAIPTSWIYRGLIERDVLLVILGCLLFVAGIAFSTLIWKFSKQKKRDSAGGTTGAGLTS